MDALWVSFSGIEKAFFLCAIGGGFAFVISTAMQFLGADNDIAPGNDSSDMTSPSSGLGDTDVSFKVLSVLGLSAFTTLFGLVGLAMSRGSSMPVAPSVAAAVAAGVLNVVAIKLLFKSFGKLQSSGKSNNSKVTRKKRN